MTPTPSQSEIIHSKAKTVIAIATAGSGKTATMVQRYLSNPGKSAVITFTNAAARELRKRIADAGGPPPAFAGTLHAFCLEVLRACNRRVSIIDEETADELLKECAEQCNCSKSAKTLRALLVSGEAKGKDKLAIDRYVRTLRFSESVDYDVLLKDALECLCSFSPQYESLMVDEAQDGAMIDAQIYRCIDVKTRTFVGDFDQQIFSFRGADPESLKSFLPGAHVVKMEENFRSDHAICQAAQNIISKAKDRIEKRTLSMTGKPGLVQELPGTPFADNYSETAAIVDTVRTLLADNPNETVGILCRYNQTKNDIAKALINAGLIQEQTDRLPKDWKHAILTIQAWANPKNRITAKAWLVSAHGKDKADQILKDLLLSRREPETGFEGLSLSQVMEKAQLSRDARQRIWKAAEDSPDPSQLLLALRDAGNAPEPSRVSVLTCHGAKGLEFNTVVIAGCENEVFKPTEPEERRLFFVAVTRAKNRLFFSHCKSRRGLYAGAGMNFASKSQFIIDAFNA